MIQQVSCKHFLILFLLLSIFQLNAQNENKMSIDQCVEFALKNNLQVKNALINIAIQKQTNKDITSAALPFISSSINVIKFTDIPTSLIPISEFDRSLPPNTYAPVQFGVTYNSTADIRLEQLLFDGQVFIAIQARRATVDWVNKNYEITQETIKANILKICYQLVASKTQIALLDANLKRIEQLLQETAVLLKNGFLEPLDLDKLNVQFTNLKTDKTKALNSIEFGYLGLKTLMGMSSKEKLILTDSINIVDIDKLDLVDTFFNYTQRKDFQYLNITKKLNEFNIRRYQLSRLPTFSLSAIYAKNAQRKVFDFTQPLDWFTNSSYTFKLAIPIFSGLSKDAKISKSKLELRQLNDQIDQTKINIDNEIKQYRLTYLQSMEILKNQKLNMDLAEKVYNQTIKKLAVGVGSRIEITNAQTDLIAAQSNYMNALYATLISKVDLIKSLGKL